MAGVQWNYRPQQIIAQDTSKYINGMNAGFDSFFSGGKQRATDSVSAKLAGLSDINYADQSANILDNTGGFFGVDMKALNEQRKDRNKDIAASLKAAQANTLFDQGQTDRLDTATGMKAAMVFNEGLTDGVTQREAFDAFKAQNPNMSPAFYASGMANLKSGFAPTSEEAAILEAQKDRVKAAAKAKEIKDLIKGRRDVANLKKTNKLGKVSFANALKNNPRYNAAFSDLNDNDYIAADTYFTRMANEKKLTSKELDYRINQYMAKDPVMFPSLDDQDFNKTTANTLFNTRY